MPRTDNSLALTPALEFVFVPRTDNSLALTPALEFVFVPRTDNSLALAVRAGHEDEAGSDLTLT